MPLYEYKCRTCGHVMEVLQKLSDPPLRRCKACRGKVEKMISRTSFQLKGGGWYAQGYGSSGKAVAAGTEGASGGKSDDGSSAKTAKTAKKKKADKPS